jgi:hypothetical protein
MTDNTKTPSYMFEDLKSSRDFVNITPEKQQEVEALVLKMIDKRQQIVACM